ncbi:TetR/AcrR family transcriptional regulator [Cryobacterium ruanii]|uniref:TetR/AcrR family transcriptional regulator n=1 Tax=Cryobacterium ruanii TaxID=1259197 RepID=A0A4R9AJ13_9MICO|nr:TetR/AcrR family transcriptional regulator [Cryobacterium ruanii]
MTHPPMPSATAHLRVLTRKDRHQEAKLRVERSAVSLVFKHGFNNVTVAMICSHGGISQRTFFHYFQTQRPPSSAPNRSPSMKVRPAPSSAPPAMSAARRAHPDEGDRPARRHRRTAVLRPPANIWAASAAHAGGKWSE